MSDTKKSTKKRNYSNEEKKILKAACEPFLSILTDHSRAKIEDKNKAWVRICKSFNDNDECYERSVKQLRKYFYSHHSEFNVTVMPEKKTIEEDDVCQDKLESSVADGEVKKVEPFSKSDSEKETSAVDDEVQKIETFSENGEKTESSGAKVQNKKASHEHGPPLKKKKMCKYTKMEEEILNYKLRSARADCYYNELRLERLVRHYEELDAERSSSSNPIISTANSS